MFTPRVCGSRVPLIFSLLLAASLPMFASGFGPVIVYPAGSGPSSVVVGFFNQDNYPDIAVTNQLSNTVSILLGAPGGTFQPAVDYSVGLLPTAVAEGNESDSGGPVVLAVANSGSNDVSILVSNGDGTFQPAVNYGIGTGTSPQGIAWADFNADNNFDLAVADATGGTNNKGNIAILFGNGDGTFQPAVNFDSGGLEPVSLTVAPFFVSYIQDLAVVNQDSNNVSILMNDGNGNFTVSSTYPVGTAPTYISSASGLFPSFASFVANSGSNDMTELDFNNGIVVHSKNFAVGAAPSSLSIGSFNRSRYLPGLAVANESDNTVSVFLGKQQKPNFRKPVTYSTCMSPRSVVAVDLNQDNLSDLVLACSNGVGVMINSGP